MDEHDRQQPEGCANGPTAAAASWLVAHQSLLPPGEALDVACGRGRHALWLASRGWQVMAIDRDQQALAALSREARDRGLAIQVEARDLETGEMTLGSECFDLVVVVHYLNRPLFPHLIEALRPGGVLVYETFTRAQAARGRPTNPAFLLEPGELRRLSMPLEAMVYREGDYEGRFIASVVARKP